VVTGEDQSGVSRAVNWQGGGGFRFLEVGAPLLIKDQETLLTILNPHYKNGPLVRAVCNLEGFLLTGDGLLHGRNGTHWAHVTEDFVDDATIGKLRRKLPQGHSLTIYALKAKRGLKPPPAIAVKRMNVELVKQHLRKRP
jgi:adenine-specific DNA-methyltransferase